MYVSVSQATAFYNPKKCMHLFFTPVMLNVWKILNFLNALTHTHTHTHTHKYNVTIAL